ncbi:MAG: hypothetical protein GY953_28800, partial [bacterium]|nr:hypothetical protein [bacterium]
RVNINMRDSYLSSNYHSLQIAVNKSFSMGLMLKGAYTYSQPIGMSDDDGWAGVNWDSVETHHRNRARAGFDRTQMFQLGFLYELPMGPGYGVANSGAAKWVLGGWQVSGILAAVTGNPRTIGASGSSLNAASNSQTADQIAPLRKLGGVGPGQHYYDPNSFAPITEQRFGTTGRNIVDGPGRSSIDMSIFKNFQVSERLQTQFRAEFF